MAEYTIEVYEVHVQKFTVEAKNRVDAIKMFMAGQADSVDDSLEYLELCEHANIDGLKPDLQKDVIKAIKDVEGFTKLEILGEKTYIRDVYKS